MAAQRPDEADPIRDEEDAAGMGQGLQALAAQWRERLKDPLVKELVEAGKIEISPLVKALLGLPAPRP